MVRCLAETMGEGPCFAFAWLSKYDKDTMPSYLTRCWKATKHLRGTRTRCFFPGNCLFFPRNCRSEPHGVIRMYDWSNVMKGLQPSSTLAPFLVPCRLQSSYSNIPANMLVLAPSGAGLPKNKTVLDDWAICWHEILDTPWSLSLKFATKTRRFMVPSFKTYVPFSNKNFLTTLNQSDGPGGAALALHWLEEMVWNFWCSTDSWWNEMVKISTCNIPKWILKNARNENCKMCIC